MRAVAKLVPILGTGALKGFQLLLLLAVAYLAPGGDRAFLLAAVAILATFAILSDAGGATYLLTLPRSYMSVRLYRRAVASQAGFSLLGALASLSYLHVAGLWIDVTPEAATVVAVIAGTQALDSVTRAAKSPLLTHARPAKYGAIDLSHAVGKVGLLGVALIAGNLQALYFLPFISGAILVAVFGVVSKGLPSTSEPGAHSFSIFRMLEVGASSALSALYSQSAVLMGALVLTPSEVATLGVVTRLTQAFEFVPGTLMLQVMPDLISRTRTSGRVWRQFVVVGMGISVLASVAFVGTMGVFHLGGDDIPVFAGLAAALVLKSGNYGLVGVVLTLGLARARITLNLALGAAAFVLAGAAGTYMGLIGLSASVVLIEAVVGLGLFLLVRVGGSGAAQPGVESR